VSRQILSTITDRALEGVAGRQSPPLHAVNPVGGGIGHLGFLQTPHLAMPSSGGGQFGGERSVFVEQLAVLEAAVDLADHAVEEVPLGAPAFTPAAGRAP
jgi:hypothetical protein